MSIAFNSTISLTSASASYTIPSGMSIILVGCEGTIGSDTISGVTIAGNAMTLIGKLLNPGINGRYTYLFRYYNPPSGSQTITVVGTGFSEGIIGFYTGSEFAQTSSTSSYPESTLSISTATVTTVNNSWVVSYVGISNGNALSAGASTTFRSPGVINGFLDSNAAVSPAASRTLNGNIAGGAGVAIIQFELTVSGGSSNMFLVM